jgi:carboxymethylenebutenolidase
MCHQTCPYPAPIAGGAGVVEERVEIPGADRPIPAFFVRPEGDPRPAVLLIHDIWGANDFYQDVARRLAGAGYAALLPDFFARQGALVEQTREAARARGGELDYPTTLADIGGAISWLQEHPATTANVGTIGFCMGGTLVMLAAARDPLPHASVAFYGFPVFDPTERRPDVPIAEASSLRSPLLAVWGDQDHGVGMDKVEAYRAALAEADRVFEFVVYPGPGHAFLTFDAAAPWYDEARDAWERTVTFLREELAG